MFFGTKDIIIRLDMSEDTVTAQLFPTKLIGTTAGLCKVHVGNSNTLTERVRRNPSLSFSWTEIEKG